MALSYIGFAGFQSHSHLQAGLASLAVAPDAVVSFLDQAHIASRDRVHKPLSIASSNFPYAKTLLRIKNMHLLFLSDAAAANAKSGVLLFTCPPSCHLAI